MRNVYEQDILERLNFVREAAAAFSADPSLSTYTSGAIEPGCYFAVKWGLGNDCVLLLKLDDNLEPEIYGQVIEKPLNPHSHSTTINVPKYRKPDPGEEWPV